MDRECHDSNPPTNDNETEPPDPETQKLYDLLHKADEPLWSGCSKLSQLSTVTRLLNIKSEGCITEKVFDDILKLLKDALPSDNKLVGSFYDTEKYAADLGLSFRQIVIGCWELATEESVELGANLTCTMLKEEDMIRLHEDIPVILCKLERIFPPGFFDFMEHLPMHLPYEARVGGPVQYRWMYPFERFLGKLKRKVTNKAKVESSIANAYLIEETSMFCLHYFEPHVRTKMNAAPRNDCGGISRRLTDGEYDAARIYVLLNCVEIEEYVEIFIEEIKANDPTITDDQVDQRLESEFADWFNHYAHNSGKVDNQIIKDVALGPLRSVTTYPMYFVNGYKFHTSEHGSRRSTFNSGVCIKGTNYGDMSTNFYGVLSEIVKLEYPALPIRRVVLFRCDWFDTTSNIRIKIHKEYKLVDINRKRRLRKYEPTSTFDLPEENTALQDDEVEAHSIDAADLLTIPLNDSSGIQVDMDDGDDDLQHSGDDND
ncbi:hypothetical protein Tco_0738090 [Tanacetum coccineum]